MAKKKSIAIVFITSAIVGVLSLHLTWDNSRWGGSKHEKAVLEAAYEGSLRQKVDETCGACHSNLHIRPAGDYSLNSGNAAKTAGANGVIPTEMVNDDPLTALIVRKPLEGSVTPHGGIKIPESHPTIQAIIGWLESGADPAELNREAPIALSYPSMVKGNLVAADEHVIVYTKRKFRPSSFSRALMSAPGGNIYVMKFKYDAGLDQNVISYNQPLLNLPATDDVQSPTVSLDGNTVAFARRQGGGNWEIWRVDLDGSNLHQITKGPGHKIQPFFLPFEPSGLMARSGRGGIGFLSTASGYKDEYNTGPSRSLFVCDDNGENMRQIDFNPSHDMNPWLHSSGMLIFTRWEHNEHQRHNFMSLFQLSASDYLTAGTQLFGAFGEHIKTDGNSFFESSEVLDEATFGQTDDLLNPTYGKMIVRRSDRDDHGGSIGGPFIPRLQGAVNTMVGENTIAVGDFSGMEMNEDDIVDMSSITYRNPISLLKDQFIVSYAVSEGITPVETFMDGLEYEVAYSSFALMTFNLSGNKMVNERLLIEEPGYSMAEAVPVVIKPQPPKIGKPVDHTKTTGVFTSGDVTDRQTGDRQTRGFDVSRVKSIRFTRSLQLSQGDVDTGRDNDEGIATQILGEVPISSDGSFSAEVPANVPMQFQLMDKEGRVLVNHKPWLHVARGATERCVGCHAEHDKPASFQTLVARQQNPVKLNPKGVRQFHFHDDIQPILNAHCVRCHDSAITSGAAGRKRGLSLTGRETPARTTEAFQSLIGGGYVVTQQSRASELMWWLTGKKLDEEDLPDYPTDPEASVPHTDMLSEEDLTKITNWIDTGINFRVIDSQDGIGQSMMELNQDVFTNLIWPILETRCLSCHTAGGQGGLAMNLDGDPARAESEQDLIEDRMEQLGYRINFIIPEASTLLRKPLPQHEGGLTHDGLDQWAKGDDTYMAIYSWIATANPAAAPAPAVTDLVGINNYPNPFRTDTTFVYGLTGNPATKVTLRIYSQNGKLIRELAGTVTQNTTIGWNKIVWNGKDKNGNTVGNDIYFYTIDAEFSDGTKKNFRGKTVKIK